MGFRYFRYRRFCIYWLPVYLYAGIIFFYSSQSDVALAPKIIFGDKLLHLIEYAILSLLIARAAKNSASLRLRTHFRIFALTAAFLYGVTDEVHQYFVPGRFAEVWDLVVDGLGALLGQLLIRR